MTEKLSSHDVLKPSAAHPRGMAASILSTFSPARLAGKRL